MTNPARATPTIRTAISLFALVSLLAACSASEYDRQREWRLRECEKLLYTEDINSCKAATPDYVE